MIIVCILTLPIIFNILKVLTDPSRRRVGKEYGMAILNQLYIPYLGYQTIRNPDKKLIEKHWTLKVSSVKFLCKSPVL